MKLTPPRDVRVADLGAAIAFLVSSRSAWSALAPVGRGGTRQFGRSPGCRVGRSTDGLTDSKAGVPWSSLWGFFSCLS